MDPLALRAVDWLPPWARCEPGLESELAREVGPHHPLAGRVAVAVARRVDTDDVLFFLPDGPKPLRCASHMDWPLRTFARMAFDQFYVSLEDWIEQRMRPDNADPDANR